MVSSNSNNSMFSNNYIVTNISNNYMVSGISSNYIVWSISNNYMVPFLFIIKGFWTIVFIVIPTTFRVICPLALSNSGTYTDRGTTSFTESIGVANSSSLNHNRWRCPWCNYYRRRKWTRRHEFKSWTRLIAFHIALIPLEKVWIQLFSLQLWVNSGEDWVL